MKAILLLLILCLPIRAEDWTVKGKVYPGVKVLKVDADTVSFLDSEGGATLEISDLPVELQKRFDYDPAKAAIAAKIKSDELKAEDAAYRQSVERQQHMASALKASSIINQVLPNGFIGSIMLKDGQLDTCFIKCDSKGMIDGQMWSGLVLPAGTFSYSDVQGGSQTVAQFTTNLTQEPTAMPQLRAYPRPASWGLQSVGGG
jgi:hypothetical protein